MQKINYVFLLTAILTTVFLGCQPGTRDGAISNGNRIVMDELPQVEATPSARADIVEKPAAEEEAPAGDSPRQPDAPEVGKPVQADSVETIAEQSGSAAETPLEEPVVENGADAGINADIDEELGDDLEVMEDASAPDSDASVVNDEASDLTLVGARLLADCKDLLATYVDKHGNVDYATLRRRRSELYRIVREFDNLDPREYLPWGRNDKIAFWLNAYNMFTLRVVVDNYPIESSWVKVMLNYPRNSIVHVKDAWTKKYFRVMGIEYTLREIEREILLQRFEDPRICLALSYASMGGAMLRNEPYYPDRLDEQLDDQCRRFLADRRGFQIDHNARTVYLSDVFNWYKQDFIGKYGDVRRFRDKPQPVQAYLNFAIQYISEADVRYLESQDYTVEFRKYDWRLNEQ